MKERRRFQNNKGFTMAEVLIVVAILGILAAVITVGIISMQKSLKQKEYDEVAEEIFIAAQNHLSTYGATQLNEQYELYSDGDNSTMPSYDLGTNRGTGYFYVRSIAGVAYDESGNALSSYSDSILNILLPFASIDETVRSGGNFVIRYEATTATVTDVWYSKKDGNRGAYNFTDYDTYAAEQYTSGDNSRKQRMNFSVGNAAYTLGYYGGVNVTQSDTTKLNKPTLSVTNKDVLSVEITDTNQLVSGNGYCMSLVITGELSGAKLSLPIVKDGQYRFLSAESEGYIKRTDNGGIGASKSYTYDITLDDITKDSLKFNALMGAGASGTTPNGESTCTWKDYLADKAVFFAPGEDIKIQAVSYNSKQVTNVGYSTTKKTNSLFAKIVDVTDEILNTTETQAYIASIRHLENLDASISSFDPTYVYTDEEHNTSTPLAVAVAVQKADLDWNSFKENVNNSSYAYVPVGDLKSGETGIEYLTTYNGGSKTVKNLVVVANDYAGMFGCLTNTTVSDLELVDFDVTANKHTVGYAGTLAGYFSGTSKSISNVIAYNTATSTDYTKTTYGSIKGDYAGGLCGRTSGAMISYSAAAVLVQGEKAAGGLIGDASSSRIYGCYTGGFTSVAKYITDTENAHNYNVSASAANGVAGGLVGSLSDASNIFYSYATASAYTAGNGGAAGGLIGTIANAPATGSGYISNCYSVGAVGGYYVSDSDCAEFGNFIGAFGTGSYYTFTNDRYLLDVSTHTTSIGQEKHSEIVGAPPSDLSPETSGKAYAYDATLAGRYSGNYSYFTIAQLLTKAGITGMPSSTLVHYGDWMVSATNAVSAWGANTDKLTLHIPIAKTSDLKNNSEDNTEFSIWVHGKTSGNSRFFRLEYVVDDLGNKNVIITKAAQSTTNSIDWKNVTADLSIEDRYAYGVPVVGYVQETPSGETEEYACITLNMDDITTSGQNFYSLFGIGENPLLPGENVVIRVAEAELDAQSSFYTYGSGITKNSLFADNTSDTSVQITHCRHLQNLEPAISGIATSTAASNYVENVVVGGNMNWTDFMNETGWTADAGKIYNYDCSKVITGSFYGISNETMTSFDGANCTISNLPIYDARFDGETEAADAALFTEVLSGTTIKNLRMKDYVVSSSTGNAATFVSVVGGSKDVILDTLLAEGENAKITVNTAGKAAGGLFGVVSTSGNVVINNCAATNYVISAGDAGGLVGVISNGTVTITNSYSGGHTKDGKYQDAVYVDALNGVGGWNTYSTGGHVGGLIGSASGSGTSVKIGRTFSAASAKTADASKAAGDVIGYNDGAVITVGYSTGEGATLEKFPVYTVAPVSGVSTYSIASMGDGTTAGSLAKDATLNGAFAGDSTNKLTNAYSYYLPEIYDENKDLQYYSAATYNEVTGEYTYDLAKVSNIAVIGGDISEESGKLKETVQKAYFSDGTENNAIAARNDVTHMQDATYLYDATNTGAEYPFSMWTVSAFDGTSGIYFYGDWEPVRKAESVNYILNFVYIDPSDGSEHTIRTTEIPFNEGYVTTIIPPAPPYVEVGTFEKWSWGDGKTSTLQYAAIGITDADVAKATVYTDEETNTTTRTLKITASYTLDNNKALVKFFYAGNRTKYAGYDATNNAYPDYPSDVAANASLYTQIGSTQKVDITNGGVTVAASDIRIPSRNIGGYRFSYWQDASGNRVDLTDDYNITGNLILYAVYDKITYYTITVDFVYADNDGDTAHLYSVPVYRIGDQAQYQLQQKTGEIFDKVIKLPAIGNDQAKAESFQYRDGSDTYVPVTGTGEGNAGNGYMIDSDNDGIYDSIRIVASASTNYLVSYSGLPDTSIDYYKIIYRMHDTDRANATVPTYTATNTTDVEATENYDTTTLTYKNGEVYAYAPYTTTAGVGTTASSEIETNGGTVKIFRTPAGTVPAIKPKLLSGFAEPVSANVTYRTDGTEGTGTKTDPYVYYIDYYRNSYSITYNSQGGTYVEPVMYAYGAPIDDTEARSVTRTGFSLGTTEYPTGWSYRNQADSTAAEIADLPATMPAYNVLATTHWTGAPANYRVLYWYENADDDGYTLDESLTQTKQSNVGTMTTITESNISNASKTGISTTTGVGDRSNYYFDRIENTMVAANGNAVVNVYFKRYGFYVYFMVQENSYYSLYTRLQDAGVPSQGAVILQGVSDGNIGYGNGNTYYYKMNGVTYAVKLSRTQQGSLFNRTYTYTVSSFSVYNGTDAPPTEYQYYTRSNRPSTQWVPQEELTIFEKWGKNVSALWPSNRTGLSQTWPSRWMVSATDDVSQSGISAMPAEDKYFYYTESSGRYTLNANYWLELPSGMSAPSGAQTTTISGVTYYLDHTDSFKSDSNGYTTTEEDFYPINGFTLTLGYPNYNSYRQNSPSWSGNTGTWNFYYRRNQYHIHFFENPENTTSASVTKDYYYGADISEASYVPTTKPAGKEDFTFDGWYTNSLGEGDAYDFAGKVIYDSDIRLYAKWKSPTYTVTFDPQGGTMSGATAIEIPRNDTIFELICDTTGELTEAYTPTKAGYDFAGWYYNDGGTEKHFISSLQISSNMTIYAKWTEQEETKYSDVTVIWYYEETDPNTGTVSEVQLNSKTITHLVVGNTYVAMADSVDGYYPYCMSQSLIVDEDVTKNIIKIRYIQIAPWQYTINYYVRYQNLTNGASWISDDAIRGLSASDPSYTDVLIETTTARAYSQYSLVAYAAPADIPDFYTFWQYEYDENGDGDFADTDETGTDVIVIIHPDENTKTAVLNFYMKPDASQLAIEDRYEVYDGTSKKVDSAANTDLSLPYNGVDTNGATVTNPAPADGSTVTVTNYYQYYSVSDASAQITSNNSVIDAGTYLMRTYVVATVTEGNGNTHTYLLRRTDENDYQYLYVDRRGITLISANGSWSYDGNVHMDDTIYAVFDDDPITYDGNGNPLTYTPGFVGNQGASYTFAVDAFRRNKGTSKNVFDYVLYDESKEGKDYTNLSNYSITKQYGTLTVTD